MNRRLLWLGLPALGLVAVFVASVAGESDGGGSGTPVEIALASRRTISSRVKASGEIAPERKADISARVVGEIIDLPVREGDRVKEGQILLRIERRAYEAMRDQARAAMEQSEVARQRLEVQLATAKRNLERVRELKTRDFTSQESVEAAEDAVKSATIELESQRHTIEQARSALTRASEDLELTTIRSPMDGVVAALNTEKGETAVPGSNNVPGSVLMTIADLSRIVADVEVSEIDVVNLKAEQPAEVRVDALGDKVLAGRVVEIGSSGRKDPATGAIRFRVKVAIEAPDAALRPSMTAKVAIVAVDRNDVLSVPVQAVVERRIDGDGNEIKEPTKEQKDQLSPTKVVYVAEKGKAKLREVDTGTSNELFVEILSGLDEKSEVVVGPYRTLKELHDGEAIHGEVKASEEKKPES